MFQIKVQIYCLFSEQVSDKKQRISSLEHRLENSACGADAGIISHLCYTRTVPHIYLLNVLLGLISVVLFLL